MAVHPEAQHVVEHDLTIKVDGTSIGGEVVVRSIVVREAASQPARLELVIDSGAAAAFKADSEIRVAVDGGPIFSGTIQTVSDQLQDGHPVALVVAEDAMRVLRHVFVSQVFEQMKSSDILQRVLSAAGLSGEVPASAVALEQHVVVGQTSLDLCMNLAAEAGWIFRCQDKDVTFIPLDKESAAVVKCTAGESLLHFSGAEREVPGKVSFKSWDLGKAEVIHAEKAVKAKRKGKDSMRHSAAQELAIVDFQAAGAALELGAMSFAGQGAMLGSTLVKVGVHVELQGASGPEHHTTFPSGAYLVTACEHRVEAGTFVTNFAVGLSEPLPRPPRAAPPLLPAVIKRTDDPAALGRLLVTLPTLEGAVWAHAAVPFGGFHFPHAVGDQVLVSFLPDDPPVPVIIGALPTASARAALKLPKATEGKRGRGQIAYGGSVLTLAPGDEGPAGASLSGKTCKIELVDGEKVLLQGPGAATVELVDGHVRLKVGAASILELDASMLHASVVKLEALAQALISLRSNGAFDMHSAATIDVKSAVVSINGDALRIT